MTKIEATGFETMSPVMEFADNYNNWILSKFAPYIGGNILEIGTGQGNFKKYLSQKVENYYSVDIDEDVIKRAKLRDPEGNYIVMDAAAPDFSEKLNKLRLDAVLCVNVLEHIPAHEKAFSNMMQVLKAGGHLLLFVPAFNFLFNDLDSIAGHNRRYRKSDITALINSSEQECIFIEYFNPIGGIGWWINNLISHNTLNNAKVNNQVELFDKYGVAFSRVLNGVTKSFFGQSIIAVIKKK